MLTSTYWEPILGKLRKLRTDWPARGWTWDSRFLCVSSSISIQFEAKAKAAISQALVDQYDSATLSKAPPTLRDVVERTGGLRAGQFLYGGIVEAQPVIFGLWWPWGNGETISMRVGLAGVDVMREPYPSFRDVFGASLY